MYPKKRELREKDTVFFAFAMKNVSVIRGIQKKDTKCYILERKMYPKK